MDMYTAASLDDLSHEAILARLKQIVWAVIDDQDREHVELNSITAETELAVLPLDSLATIELLYSIEETFNIPMTDGQAFEMSSIGDVIQFIQEKQLSRADATALLPA